MFNSPYFWPIMRVLQFANGVGNAYMMIIRLSENKYGYAALSGVCVLLTACWLFPKKETDGNA